MKHWMFIFGLVTVLAKDKPNPTYLVVDETGNATLRCSLNQVIGWENVSGEVVWKKGRAATRQERIVETEETFGFSRIKIRHHDGALIIKHVAISDENIYTCIRPDKTEFVTNLFVRVNPSKVTVSGPKVFFDEPRVHEVRCHVDRIKPSESVSILWTKDHQPLNESEVSQRIGFNSDKTWMVTSILSARFHLEDDGMILGCHVKWDEEKEIMGHFKITVHGVRVSMVPNPVLEGGKLNLTCLTKNDFGTQIPVRYLWSHRSRNADGKLDFYRKPLSHLISHFTSIGDGIDSRSLYLKHVFRNLSGEIFCDVSTDPDNHTLTGSAMLRIYYLPTVTVDAYPSPVLQGRAATFSCRAKDGNPNKYQYTWYRLANRNISMNLAASFVIWNISATWDRVFLCEVSSKAGSVYMAASLDIYYLPRVSVKATPNPVLNGHEVRLTCDVTKGHPPSFNLTWYRKTRRLVPLQSNVSQISFHICDDVMNMSQIICEISSAAGMVRDSVVLVVLKEEKRNLSPLQMAVIGTFGCILLFFFWFGTRIFCCKGSAVPAYPDEIEKHMPTEMEAIPTDKLS